MTDSDARAFVEAAVAGAVVTGAPGRLTGGLMNEVWRVPGRPAVIVKYAPPFIASSPEIPLDPGRMVIEGRCLRLLGPGGVLEQVATDEARPPRLLAIDESVHCLAMEDVGEAPHLGEWLAGATLEEVGITGRQLGAFIGRLHADSAGDGTISRKINNQAIQQTRLVVQYRAICGILTRCGVADAAALGQEAVALGERLLGPGRCLVMGDLWPPSVLVTPAGLRVIDWEFAHYGNPAQDIAHLAAHLWMIEHRGRGPGLACWEAFRAAYVVAAGPAMPRLWQEQTHRDATVHAACEIIVRAAGAFQAGYLYDGHTADDTPVREAIAHAVMLLRSFAPFLE